jgi:hypothetical protein
MTIYIYIYEFESYVTTDGQPASLSWSKAPIWGLRPDLYYLCDSYGLVLVGRPLWRDVESVFLCAAGPCQRSLYQVRVSWGLRPYFTVSDLRIPFSSPPPHGSLHQICIYGGERYNGSCTKFTSNMTLSHAACLKNDLKHDYELPLRANAETWWS